MQPPRVLIAMLGLDQHETGALAVAGMLRDAGMDVIYIGRFGSPETIAAAAFDEAVDVVGISVHSWEYLHYVDDLLARLVRDGEPIPLVFGGAVITPSDRAALLAKGVAAAFGAQSGSDDIVTTIRQLARRGGDAPATNTP